ncbi:hypothetical protein [Paenirhodobacter sp.]|uniref:hypothetical protein n=1 Tax=Paenirhodobacter sp. TaxID=1965326 RepID=UPI003B3D7B90
MTDLAVLARNCVELLGGNEGEWHAQAEKTFREGRDLFGGETSIPFLPEFLEINKAGMQRDGTVRCCLSAEVASRKDGIETGGTGPGFDCGKAGTPAEVAICSSQDCGRWTERLRTSFVFQRAADSAKKTAFLDNQRARDACSGDQACLVERYTPRLFDLGF